MTTEARLSRIEGILREQGYGDALDVAYPEQQPAPDFPAAEVPAPIEPAPIAPADAPAPIAPNEPELPLETKEA